MNPARPRHDPTPKRPVRGPWALALAVILLAATLGGLGATAASREAPTGGSTAPDLRGSSEVRIATGGTNTVVATLNVGASPLPGAFDPFDGLVYLPANGNELLALRGGPAPTINLTLTFAANATVQTPVVLPTIDRVYVPIDLAHGDALTVIAGDTGRTVATVPLPNGSAPGTPVYDPALSELFVPESGTGLLTVVSTASNTIVGEVSVGSDPLTPALDPGSGDVYVPNLGSNNLSIVSASGRAVLATLSGLDGPTTPAFDAQNDQVYVPESNGSSLDIVAGTQRLTTVAVGQGPVTPFVDNRSGDVFVANSFGSNLSILGPSSDRVVASPATGTSPVTPMLDPVNGELYVANSFDGSVSVLNGTAWAPQATIGVGYDCEAPVFDAATDQMFVANYATNNVSVIAAGPQNRSSFAGSYTVSFEANGLPTGTAWSVTLDGTELNATTARIDFFDVGNGTHAYGINAPGGYFVESPSPSGQVAVRGASQAVAVAMAPLTTNSSGGSGAGAGLFGLPPVATYVIAGALIVGLAILATVALTPRRPGEPPPSSPESEATDGPISDPAGSPPTEPREPDGGS